MSKYPRTWNAQRGFTLIELVVVIAIIAILAGAIVPTIIRPQLAERAAETHREMTALEEAVMGRPDLGDWGFLSTIGRVPTNVSELLSMPSGWNSALFRNGVPRGWNGPYVRIASRAPGEDAWGMPYRIEPHGTISGLWRIRSFGANRVDGPSGPNNDDIFYPSPTDWYGSIGTAVVRIHYDTLSNEVPSGDVRTIHMSVADGANPSTLDRTVACTTVPQKNPCTISSVPFGLHALVIELEPGTSGCVGAACIMTRPVRVLKPATTIDVVIPDPTP